MPPGASTSSGGDSTTRETGALAGTAPFSASGLPSVVNISGCSGTVIGPRHISTAAHCFGRGSSGQTVTVSGNGVNQTTTVVSVIPNYDMTDGEVVITADNLLVEPIRVLPNESMSTWVGRRVLSSGFGAGVKNAAYLTIRSFPTLGGLYTAGGDQSPADHATICPGDSGGPNIAFLRGHPYLVGHNGGSSNQCSDTTNLGAANMGRIDRYSQWLRTIVPLRGSHIHSNLGAKDVSISRGDVDHDGRMDFIVTTATGTRLRRSTGTGFTDWSFPTTTDLTADDLTMGNIETILADVDGDNYDDLVLLSRHGLYVYRSNHTTFDINSTPFYSNTGWQIGLVNIAAGRFSGTTRNQLFMSDVNSSFLMELSNTGVATTTAVGAQFQYPIQSVTPTVGDFDGDGKADLILQDDSGATLYTGGTNGTNATLTAQTCAGSSLGGLSRGKWHLTAGNFLADAPVELLAIGTSGTAAFHKTSTSCMTSYWMNTWLANDLQFIVGNFNGDDKDDILVQTSAGAFLYTSTGSTSNPWNANVWSRTDLPLHVAQFTPGDWSNDGISDLLITTPAGLFGYKGTTSGVFQNDVFGDAALTLQTFVIQ